MTSIPMERRRYTYINGREAVERKSLYDSLKSLTTKHLLYFNYVILVTVVSY